MKNERCGVFTSAYFSMHTFYLGACSLFSTKRFTSNAADDYVGKRLNGRDKGKMPGDGKYTWTKGRVEGDWVCGVKESDGQYHYELCYDEGPKDKEWMEDGDWEYIQELYRKGTLLTNEPNADREIVADHKYRREICQIMEDARAGRAYGWREEKEAAKERAEREAREKEKYEKAERDRLEKDRLAREAKEKAEKDAKEKADGSDEDNGSDEDEKIEPSGISGDQLLHSAARAAELGFEMRGHHGAATALGLASKTKEVKDRDDVSITEAAGEAVSTTAGEKFLTELMPGVGTVRTALKVAEVVSPFTDAAARSLEKTSEELFGPNPSPDNEAADSLADTIALMKIPGAVVAGAELVDRKRKELAQSLIKRKEELFGPNPSPYNEAAEALDDASALLRLPEGAAMLGAAIGKGAAHVVKRTADALQAVKDWTIRRDRHELPRGGDGYELHALPQKGDGYELHAAAPVPETSWGPHEAPQIMTGSSIPPPPPPRERFHDRRSPSAAAKVEGDTPESRLSKTQKCMLTRLMYEGTAEDRQVAGRILESDSAQRAAVSSARKPVATPSRPEPDVLSMREDKRALYAAPTRKFEPAAASAAVRSKLPERKEERCPDAEPARGRGYRPTFSYSYGTGGASGASASTKKSSFTTGHHAL